MKTVRLLPVVIFAISALLVLKTIGLATTGGFVLGTTAVVAAEGQAAAASADTPVSLPEGPTMGDTSPVLTDNAPTLGQGATGANEAAPSSAHEAAPAAADAGAHAPAPTSDSSGLGANEVATNDTRCPAPVVMHETALPVTPEASNAGGFADAMTDPACDPRTEGVPMELDAGGKLVPLAQPDGSSLTERALLERLSARRTELDTYANELDMRQAIVDAAEKKIDERAVTLKALEAQIASLVDQRQAMEDGQFAGIVTMYENMKPKDAANIFNDLDMSVLLRVAKAINPRKMAPILAAMTSKRAQELTVKMASNPDTPTDTMTQADLAALPQIVGQ